jgi:hypothetical protein
MRIEIDDARLTRAERRRRERQLRKLEASAARVTEADRLYFERFPQRNHRIRLAAAAEIEGLRIASGDPVAIPPGYALFMVVRKLAPGVQMWRFLLHVADAAAEIDVMDETMAAKIWEKVSLAAEQH